MFENIRLSFRGIWAHKMRSFLTMLGIIIGIAAIIAIVSTIKGTNEQIKQNLVGTGENTVEISLYQGEWEYEMEYNGIPEGVPLVADEVVEQLKEIPHVENVSRYLSRQDYNVVYHLNTGLSGGYKTPLSLISFSMSVPLTFFFTAFSSIFSLKVSFMPVTGCLSSA